MQNHLFSMDGWFCIFAYYLMATSIAGTASIGRATGVDIDVEFSDILETLNIAAMAHFEAHHKSGWGIWLDYGFMDLSQDTSGPKGGIAATDLRQGVMEAFAGIIYVINDLLDIDLTYKATWVDYEEGTKRTPGYFEHDTVTYGPILGLNFKF